MYTARRKCPYKTKHTACAKKPSLPEQKEAKLQAAYVGECCNECITKLQAHHSNRTAEGEAKFVAMLVDVLMLSANEKSDVLLRVLNGLSYKGKVQLKNSSQYELTRFARAAYADTQFMTRYKSKGMIVVHLFAAVCGSLYIANFIVGILADQISKSTVSVDDSVVMTIQAATFILLTTGLIYLLGRSAFRKNVARLKTVIKKY